MHCRRFPKSIHLNSILNLQIYWNKEETEVLYLAERNSKKKKKYFEEDEVKEFQFYEFEEHFGELMTEIKTPNLFHLKINEKKIIKVEGIPEHLAIGEPVLTPENDYLFTGVDVNERKIGKIYCIQRTNELYLLENESKKCTRLLKKEWNFHHPTFSKNGKELFYFTTGKEAVHRPSQVLKKINWEKKQEDSEIVEISKNLYVNSQVTPGSWFDDQHLLLNVIHHFHLDVYILNVENGKIQRLSKSLKIEGSLVLLDSLDNFILVSVQTPLNPFQVLLVEVDKDFKTTSTEITSDVVISKKLENYTWKVDSFKEGEFEIEYLSILPPTNENEKLPLIVNPHGGPHSASLSIFRLEMVSYFLSGFAIINTNYRGSIGYTKEFIDSLPGHVGDYDVKDVHHSVLDLIKKGKIDENKISVLGGSHGGFLGGHLVGQFPDFYKCAILHNPVTNIANMIGTTDIPDWCFIEAGFDPYEHKIITKEILEKAFEISPMFHVSKVKSPVLFLLGEVDLRVPIEQGKQFYFALKSRNVETKIMMYPGESHPISSPDCSVDRFVSTLLWIKKNI
jgi:acylaminoacyl-peptidase